MLKLFIFTCSAFLKTIYCKNNYTSNQHNYNCVDILIIAGPPRCSFLYTKEVSFDS